MHFYCYTMKMGKLVEESLKFLRLWAYYITVIIIQK